MILSRVFLVQEGGAALAQDRRNSRRFALEVQLMLVLADGGLQTLGKTRDISSAGFFCYSDVPVVPEQEIEVLMTLPYEFSGIHVAVACGARVLRVERGGRSAARTGIAAAFLDFRFLRGESISIDTTCASG